MEIKALLAIALFVVVYALIISEKLHRTLVAMLGGLAMVALGIVTQEQALQHIDFNTLGLLVGMMIIVGMMQQTGFFSYLAILTAKKMRGKPPGLLVGLSLLTAVASAFLDNLTTVLLMVPVVFDICRRLELDVKPFLIIQILASNIGGTATMIGDPPNIMIGSAVPHLDFLSFINHLGLISGVILAITLVLTMFFYRTRLTTTAILQDQLMLLNAKDEILDRVLLKKSLIVLFMTLLGFGLHQVLHLESAAIALTGAFILMFFSGAKQVEQAFEKVEWTTIFFFIGLFMLVSGLIETGLIRVMARETLNWTGGDLAVTATIILWISAIASAFIDNIPFVATMIPLIQEMEAAGLNQSDPLWWSLALGACLGGNGTIIGASANVIVAGMAEEKGCPISFGGFFKVAFPLMFLSIVISNIYIYWRYL